MYENTRIGVVVPVFNEAAFVGDVIESVPPFVDTVYVVDDRSTDRSWDVIQGYTGNDDPPVVVAESEQTRYADGGVDVSHHAGYLPGFDGHLTAVRHAINRGRGGAIKTGYRLALEDDMDVIAVMDGDGQMDGDILDRIITPVVEGDAVYAKGNRLVNWDSVQGMPNLRLFGNGILSILTKIASGYWGVRDPQNGYTAISADTLETLPLEDLYDDYGFLNDLLIRIGARGDPVTDVPMRAVYDDEESGIEYRSFVPQLSGLLLRMYCWRLWVTYGPGEV